MRVAFQGVQGAYSEVALRAHFGNKAEPLSCAFSEEVFDAVASGEAQRGFLPIENSIAGPVAVNADLFAECKVFVTAEAYLRIEHCLLAPKGTRLDAVTAVYSHPVALAQCRDFLKKRDLKAVPEYDTAGAAKLVAARRVLGEAAIASTSCAEAYGLEILAKNIQSVADNFTRFWAFVKGSRPPAGLKMEKTSVVFTAGHRPGALLECLRRFADHKINLTRLESRPLPSNPFEYSFHADFLGGARDPGVLLALRELARDAHRVKVLGSYPVGARPRSVRSVSSQPRHASVTETP